MTQHIGPSQRASGTSTGASLRTVVPFERGFRCFFWAGALYAGLFVPTWTAMWLGALPLKTWITPSVWHAHEMVFGFVAAAAAGFLLTAVPNWTGAPPVRGTRLAALLGLWALGRIGFALADRIPAGWVAALDLPFLPVLALCLAGPLLAQDPPRNRRFLSILALWSVLNAAIHGSALRWIALSPSGVLELAVHLVLLLLAIIASRVVPLFTANAFRRSGEPHDVRHHPRMVRLGIGCLIGVLLLDAIDVTRIGVPAQVSALLAAVAAVTWAIVAWEWRGVRTWRDPLVWSLHLAFVWVPIGLALDAASDAGIGVPKVAALHAYAVGAFGGMILAMMTRVSLGHTGRALEAPSGMAIAYLAVASAAVIRVSGALFPEVARASLILSAALWGLAFAGFVWIYTPILLRPRTDGLSG